MRLVLVLNQDFTPLTICSAQRAFLLIYSEKAELLQEKKDMVLRSVSRTFPYPSVIRVLRYINKPFKGVILNRQNVFKRDHHTCQYCGTQRDLTLDHLIPRSKGGKSTWTNLVTACKNCNAKKGDFTPEEVGMKLHRKPLKPTLIGFINVLESQNSTDWGTYLSYNQDLSA